MPKYTITVTETITYGFDIEADTARSASRLVRDKFLAMNSNEQFSHSTGIPHRTFEAVTDTPVNEAECEFYDDDEFEYGDEEQTA